MATAHRSKAAPRNPLAAARRTLISIEQEDCVTYDSCIQICASTPSLVPGPGSADAIDILVEMDIPGGRHLGKRGLLSRTAGLIPRRLASVLLLGPVVGLLFFVDKDRGWWRIAVKNATARVD
jgi:hypothetical protein